MRLSNTRYVIYAKGHRPPDLYPRQHVVVFEQDFHARVWLERMLGNMPYVREGDELILDTGIKLRSEQFDKILSASGQAWTLPDYYAQWILRFKYGSWDEVIVNEVEATTVQEGKPAVKKIKVAREKKIDRPEGYVTVTELVAGKDIKPMNARAALRGAGLVKPDYGWSWPQAELPKIRKIIGI